MYPAAVIFDFDGVIVDTEPLHYRSFNKLLSPEGLGFSWDDYVEKYMGFDDRDAFNAIYHNAGIALESNRLIHLIESKADVFQNVIKEGLKSYAGVVDLIKALFKEGMPLAISSGALASDIKPILKMLQIEKCFSHIITADNVLHSKPDPASYIMARDRLIASYPDKLTKIDAIFAIEDTPAGISSAKGAGLKVIAVTNSYPDAVLKSADRIVSSLEELNSDNWL